MLIEVIKDTALDSIKLLPFLYITFVIDNVSTAKILPWFVFFVYTIINFIRTTDF